jgi:Ca2+-binding RTX toxin-like protein
VGGVLAANGGPTETAALLDAATNPALGRGEAIASLDTDQRGEPRPATNPDIGAFELEQSHQTVRGTQDGELLTGGRHGEALRGLAGGDRLRGGHGEDLLDGGRGADRLQGGPDGDVLIGGASADRFVFSRPHDSRPADPDLILDFSQRQGDRIDLHKLDGDPDAAGNQRLEFIGGQRFSDAGQVRALEVDGHTVIQVNLDHDRTADLRIELHDELDLHRADFVL